MRALQFDVHGGETVDERQKHHWPADLHLWMGRAEAWQAIDTLQRQLRAGDEAINLSFVGQLLEK